VLCIGGITVGGSGKSSVVRWLAEEIVARGGRPAIASRGHRREGEEAELVLPDAPDYPAERLARRAGDEAAALRSALPPDAVVVVGRDRHRAAVRATVGYGATTVLLDDGWEQDSLRWDRLWVVLDPVRPWGNGWMLPAGPLRRPRSTLPAADVVAFVLEPGVEPAPDALESARAHAPSAAVLRFRRSLAQVSPVGDRRSSSAKPGPDAPVALVTGVGAPARVERLVRASGWRIVSHAAFPDHARWTEADLAHALERAAREGAGQALITEKDEARWPRRLQGPIPVAVLRTTLTPLDPIGPHLDALAPAGGAGRGDGLGLAPSGGARFP
jgi:tetraacyldisaccharide 4'-kinase